MLCLPHLRDNPKIGHMKEESNNERANGLLYLIVFRNSDRIDDSISKSLFYSYVCALMNYTYRIVNHF